MTKCTKVGRRVKRRTLERFFGGALPENACIVSAELARKDLAVHGAPVPGQIYEVGTFVRTESEIGMELWERVA